MPENIICFYHSADLDGHCSGAIVKKFIPNCQLFGIDYNDNFPYELINNQTIIYMVDFSLPIRQMQKLKLLCKELIWIDHHISIISDVNSTNFKCNGILDINYAASLLTWKYFNNNNIPEPIQLIANYDIWDHTNELTVPFQYGLKTEYDTTPNNQELWSKLFNNEFIKYIEIGKYILKYEEIQNIKLCKKLAFSSTLNGLPAMCINAIGNSKIFNSIWDEYKSTHKLMLTFIKLKDSNTWKISIYTTHDDIDCSEIAKSFGGGGHKKAAGFCITELPFKL